MSLSPSDYNVDIGDLVTVHNFPSMARPHSLRQTVHRDQPRPWDIHDAIPSTIPTNVLYPAYCLTTSTRFVLRDVGAMSSGRYLLHFTCQYMPSTDDATPSLPSNCASYKLVY